MDDIIKEGATDVDLREEQDEGASLVEYALLVALIAVIAIVAVKLLGQQVSSQFSNVAAQI